SMQVIELIGVFLITWSIGTLLVHGLVIAVVYFERQQVVVNAFYTVYMAGCFPDIISLINAVCMYYSIIGFLHDHILTSAIVFSITVVLIATNRITAIRFPLIHASI
ncbi:hypothetical protein PENTCL1PPCAC_15992, partial [Pristionchus entomophagus]